MRRGQLHEPLLDRQQRPIWRVRRAARRGGVCQCLKWRTPENTITTPRSFAASITS